VQWGGLQVGVQLGRLAEEWKRLVAPRQFAFYSFIYAARQKDNILPGILPGSCFIFTHT
jgi:hypothetical protein